MQQQDPESTARDEQILQVLREIREMLREILVNQRMNILRERAAVNLKEHALQELIDELFAYVNKQRLLGEESWWVASEALVVRDLRTLLGRYQRREVRLGWGDVITELQTQPQSPLRDRTMEIADFMLRRELEG